MKEHWCPSEGIDATDELMGIITCNESVAVLAGAGAGKTELLAQKANYLFFTNKCVWPKRILSLTFKTEAQINIKERVNKRCGRKSTRFDSFTFHAFCKSIVDRFKNILPEAIRPINNYDIVFRAQEANGTDKILMDNLLSLAIRILRERDDIKTIFSYSYEYVFVDEFQDTTDEQYELLKILFQNTDTKVLTVGDLYQSIMLWAGARQTVFNDFLHDFSATNKFLVKNYRASKEIKDVLAVVLEHIKDPSKAVNELPGTAPNCSINVFNDEYQEASFIVENIKAILTTGVNESDICILTKQQSPQYTEILRSALTVAGINNLEMTDLQDALKEPLGQLFSLFLKALMCPSPKVMTDIFQVNLALNKIEMGDDKEEILTSNLVKLLSSKRDCVTANTSVDDLLSYVHGFIHFIGIPKIKGRWKQYKSPGYYNLVWQSLELHLRNMCSQANSLGMAVSLFNAENSVQIMNIHKCKGLEYNTVFFIGLEDQAFWSYRQNPFENNCAIYVALSRAKEKINVTYTKTRNHRVNNGHDNRSSTWNNVKPVFRLLIDKCKLDIVNFTK
jgi:superfamily I DNA/RNA helicase